MSSDINDEMKLKIYEEVGNTHRFFLNWRHAGFAGYLLILGTSAAYCLKIHKTAPQIVLLVIWSIGVTGIIFSLLDIRIRQLIGYVLVAGKKLEHNLGGYYTEHHSHLKEKSLFTHSRVVRSFYIGCSFFSFMIIYFLAFPIPHSIINHTANFEALGGSLLYFYSTIAQSMAALFAISGIFLIFRLEMIKSEIRRGIDNFRDWVVFRINNDNAAIQTLKLNIEPHSWLEKDVLDHIEEALKNAQNNLPTHVKALTDYFDYISNRLKFQTFLKKLAFPPFVVMGIIFIIAIYCLARINVLSAQILYGCVTLLLFGSAAVIIYLVIFIFFAILGPRDKNINNPKANK